MELVETKRPFCFFNISIKHFTLSTDVHERWVADLHWHCSFCNGWSVVVCTPIACIIFRNSSDRFEIFKYSSATHNSRTFVDTLSKLFQAYRMNLIFWMFFIREIKLSRNLQLSSQFILVIRLIPISTVITLSKQVLLPRFLNGFRLR